MSEHVEQRLRALVADRLGVGEHELERHVSLRDDLAVDSLDLVEVAVAIEEAWDVTLPDRLLAQVRRHDAVVVLLTRKSHDAPSMHSLVSLRAEATCAAAGGGFEVRVRVVKDKRCGPGWAHVETCRGAAGLR